MAKANLFAKLKEDDEGAIGIGTLIIFIALVLVAVIAAVVIINTASELEQKSQKVGRAAVDDVGLAVKVQQFEGQADAAGTEIVNFAIYVVLVGGADAISMQDVILHISGVDTGSSTGFSVDYLHDSLTPANQYTVTEITDPYNAYNPPSTYNLDQVSTLRIDITGFTPGLNPLSEITVLFMLSAGGAITTESATTPGSYIANGWMDLA